MCLQENEVVLVQIDGHRRHVYTKLRDYQRMQDKLTSNNGQEEFRHTNGEFPKVRIEAVGLGTRQVRIPNLPTEMSDRPIRMAQGRYGEIQEVQEGNCSCAYRYPVANGITIAAIILTQHITSHNVVAGHRTLISYQGQPRTCYGCNETGNLYQVCPRRTRAGESNNATVTTSRAVWQRGAGKFKVDPEAMEVGVEAAERESLRRPKKRKNIAEHPMRGKPPTQDGKGQTKEAPQVTVNNAEGNSNRTHITPVHDPDADVTMDVEGEDVANGIETAEGQKLTVWEMDVDEEHMSGR